MEGEPMPEAHQYRYVSWAQDGEIAVITLNRPGQMNAISAELEEELHAALHSADRTPPSAPWCSPEPGTPFGRLRHQRRQAPSTHEGHWCQEGVVFYPVACVVSPGWA
jgi:hypothetical protein